MDYERVGQKRDFVPGHRDVFTGSGRVGANEPSVSEEESRAEKNALIVTEDYIIGPEDMLEISVWRNADLSRQVFVRPDGRISLPLDR